MGVRLEAEARWVKSDPNSSYVNRIGRRIRLYVRRSERRGPPEYAGEWVDAAVEIGNPEYKRRKIEDWGL